MPIDFQNISDQFIGDLEKMQEQFIRRIEQLLKGRLDDITLAQLSAEIDFFAELNALGYETKLDEYLKGYDEIIKQVHKDALARGLSGIVGTTAADLDILATNETLFLLDKGRLYTQQFKNAIFRGVIGGETIGEILPALRNIPLTDAQLTTGVSTGITRFQASAVAKVFEESPEQRFVLEGPLDGKTRDTCRNLLEKQPESGHTKAEIDEGAWTSLAKGTYGFIDRGGFNCRHFIGVL